MPLPIRSLRSIRLLIAISVSMAACTPGAPSAHPTAPSSAPGPAAKTSRDANTPVGEAAPGEADSALSASGTLQVAVGDVRVTVGNCRPEAVSPTVQRCDDDTYVEIAQRGKTRSILLTSLYVDRDATFYRGPLDGSYTGSGHSLFLTDVDGDGYEDVIAWTGKDGAYGGPSYDVLLFDPQSQQFAASPALSELTIGANGIFRIADGGLTTTSTDGCCTRIVDTYAVEKGEPRLVERVTEPSDPTASGVLPRTDKAGESMPRRTD